MAPALDNYRYRELEFAKDGSLVDPAQVQAVGRLAGEVSDLLVISHGWNNNIEQARGLYGRLAESFDAVRAAGCEPRLAARNLGIVGVLWPSKRFENRDLIAGGAAGLHGGDPTLAADLLASSDAFAGAAAARILAEAAQLAPDLDRSPAAQRRYADLLRSLVGQDGGEPSDAGEILFRLDGAELMRRLDEPPPEELPPPDGIGGGVRAGGGGGGIQRVAAGTGGGLAGLPFGLPGTALSKGRALLNYLTYYVMKARAGAIGQSALAAVLSEQVLGRTRLHLAGHSFGARLVTAAGHALPVSDSLRSVSLLQGAFSQFAFAKDWKPGSDGAYRGLLTTPGLLNGPMIITHTRHDTAVGLAYAIASQIAGQNAAAVGDAASPYGGLGGNGAQLTPQTLHERLGDVDAEYRFEVARAHNLLADDYVADHGDVSGRQVAHAVLQAVGATA